MTAPADRVVWPSPGSDNDREWFRKHPKRSYRLRSALPEEVPDHRTGLWVIVRQVAPGLRVRAIVNLKIDDPKDDEATARRLFDELARHKPSGRIIAAAEKLGR